MERPHLPIFHMLQECLVQLDPTDLLELKVQRALQEV
jgi:hypothetical protein